MSAEKRVTTPGHTPLRDRDRLGYIALAADRPVPPGDCPDDGALARFVDREASPEEQHTILEHISVCEDCFQKWLSVSEAVDTGRERDRESGSRKRLLMTAAGSVCATAVGVMLYLSIDYQPMVQTDTAGSVYSEKASGPPAVEQKALTLESGAELEPEQNRLKAFRPDRKHGLDAEESEVAADMVMEIQRVPAERVEAPRVTSAEVLPAPALEGVEEAGRGEVKKERATPARLDSALSPLRDEERSSVQFIELFISLCGDYQENRVQQSAVEQLIEQGQELLRTEGVAGEERAVIAEITGVLERDPERDADAFTALCKRAVEFGRHQGSDKRKP